MADAILKDVHASRLFDLQGLVAVVTGGASGIGAMITHTLLSNGATVFIIDRDQDALDNIIKSFSETSRLQGIVGDVGKKSEAKRLAEEVAKQVPHVTVLFNNAGIGQGTVPGRPEEGSAASFVSTFFDGVSEEAFDNTMRVNAYGPYWLSFAFLPLLEKWKENGYGTEGHRFPPQIINTSSINGWTKDSDTAGWSYPYMFSKAAIGHATAILARELLPLGIRVNSIAPGLFTSGLTAPGTRDAYGQEHWTDRSLELPIKVPTPPLPVELGGPRNVGGSNRDIASAVLFYLSNWYVNGETVLIDGGSHLVHATAY
ncbi:unnamed protein product [Somion occarium]|uniref:Uncharacterized protein n=1 Tax=Somion occarium TaxID=3059160 RepID=A0ABP1CWC1_9APHY